jgi:hypothetical protein
MTTAVSIGEIAFTVSFPQMGFSVFDSTQLIHLGIRLHLHLRSLFCGLSIRMTRFGAIGETALTVLSPQMQFAVFDSPSLIHLEGRLLLFFNPSSVGCRFR